MSKLEHISNILVEKYSLGQADAEQFVKEMFAVIRETLLKEKQVKVKGLGTFKLTEVNGRASVDVNTGERIHIDGHTKISFTPENSVRDRINAPFAQFESFDLEDDVDFDKIDNKYSAEKTDDSQEVANDDAVTNETVVNETATVRNAQTDELLSVEENPVTDEAEATAVVKPGNIVSEDSDSVSEEVEVSSNEIAEKATIEEHTSQEESISQVADIPAELTVDQEDQHQETADITENEANIAVPVDVPADQLLQEDAVPVEEDTVQADNTPVDYVVEEIPAADAADQQNMEEAQAPIIEELVDNQYPDVEVPIAPAPTNEVVPETSSQVGTSETLQEELRRTNTLVRVLLIVVILLVICIIAFGAYVYINHGKSTEPIEETPAVVEQVDTITTTDSDETIADSDEIVSEDPAEDVEEKLNPHDLRVVGIDKEIILERHMSLKDIARDNGGDHMRDFIKDANDGRKYFERGDTVIIPKVEKKH